MEDLKDLQKQDPLKRMVERQTQKEEFSPMDPPDAYSPPKEESIAYEDMSPAIQKLMDEHKKCEKQLSDFENVLEAIQKDGMKREFNKQLGDFFSFIDSDVVAHNLKEEKILFPTLQKVLLETGQHSNGPTATTAVDMLESDHIKLMQLSAITFSYFGLAGRLPDVASRAIVLDAAIEQGKALVEMMRLHIFREDNVVFVQAQNSISKGDLDEMDQAMKDFSI